MKCIYLFELEYLSILFFFYKIIFSHGCTFFFHFFSFSTFFFYFFFFFFLLFSNGIYFFQGWYFHILDKTHLIASNSTFFKMVFTILYVYQSVSPTRLISTKAETVSYSLLWPWNLTQWLCSSQVNATGEHLPNNSKCHHWNVSSLLGAPYPLRVHVLDAKLSAYLKLSIW